MMPPPLTKNPTTTTKTKHFIAVALQKKKKKKKKKKKYSWNHLTTTKVKLKQKNHEYRSGVSTAYAWVIDWLCIAHHTVMDKHHSHSLHHEIPNATTIHLYCYSYTATISVWKTNMLEWSNNNDFYSQQPLSKPKLSAQKTPVSWTSNVPCASGSVLHGRRRRYPGNRSIHLQTIGLPFAHTIPCTVSVSVILLSASSVFSRSMDTQTQPAAHPCWRWQQLKVPGLGNLKPGAFPAHVNPFPWKSYFRFRNDDFTVSSFANSETNSFIFEWHQFSNKI